MKPAEDLQLHSLRQSSAHPTYRTGSKRSSLRHVIQAPQLEKYDPLLSISKMTDAIPIFCCYNETLKAIG
jgi:hypothetical protein